MRNEGLDRAIRLGVVAATVGTMALTACKTPESAATTPTAVATVTSPETVTKTPEATQTVEVSPTVTSAATETLKATEQPMVWGMGGQEMLTGTIKTESDRQIAILKKYTGWYANPRVTDKGAYLQSSNAVRYNTFVGPNGEVTAIAQIVEQNDPLNGAYIFPPSTNASYYKVPDLPEGYQAGTSLGEPVIASAGGAENALGMEKTGGAVTFDSQNGRVTFVALDTTTGKLMAYGYVRNDSNQWEKYEKPLELMIKGETYDLTETPEVTSTTELTPTGAVITVTLPPPTATSVEVVTPTETVAVTGTEEWNKPGELGTMREITVGETVITAGVEVPLDVEVNGKTIHIHLVLDSRFGVVGGNWLDYPDMHPKEELIKLFTAFLESREGGLTYTELTKNYELSDKTVTLEDGANMTLIWTEKDTIAQTEKMAKIPFSTASNMGLLVDKEGNSVILVLGMADSTKNNFFDLYNFKKKYSLGEKDLVANEIFQFMDAMTALCSAPSDHPGDRVLSAKTIETHDSVLKKMFLDQSNPKPFFGLYNQQK